MSISYLENLSIKHCKMLKGLIGVSKCVEEESKKSIEFSNLKRLDLVSLDKLTSFVMEINNLDDEEEKSQKRTLFDHDEVSFPCLDVLYICELPKINYIVGWKEGGRQGKEHHNKIFHVLSKLELYYLSNLIHVYEINQPGLGVLLFQNLRNLRIEECGKLRYLFSENIGRVAVKHLRWLCICKCPMMEVVMKNIEEELIVEDHDDDDKTGVGGGSNSHFFPVLERLILLNLSGLGSFCDVADTWELPSLQNLTVSYCPKLEALSPGSLDSPMLDRLQYNNNYINTVNVKDTWKGDINALLRHIKVHTKNRNRLTTEKMNDLVYVKFNSKLFYKKKRNDILEASDYNKAQHMMVDGVQDVESDVDEEIDPITGATHMEVGDVVQLREPCEEEEFVSEPEDIDENNDAECR
ncbi:uncharacterized protein LOC124913287 [Impatiens glandulifera]|uniref:uncharacterized protein LOC124913287 n=1 Tax=Impatiens glandulifera TaxID=253017 RepID=UPI001FB0DBC1|nr:uncharacterized protein LOC124913287 [Impatiens glandulifera]